MANYDGRTIPKPSRHVLNTLVLSPSDFYDVVVRVLLAKKARYERLYLVHYRFWLECERLVIRRESVLLLVPRL